MRDYSKYYEVEVRDYKSGHILEVRNRLLVGQYIRLTPQGISTTSNRREAAYFATSSAAVAFVRRHANVIFR